LDELYPYLQLLLSLDANALEHQKSRIQYVKIEQKCYKIVDLLKIFEQMKIIKVKKIDYE